MHAATVFGRVRRIMLRTSALAAVVCGVGLLTGAGCPTLPSDGASGVFNNVTDRTNGGADYIGSAACMACHPDVGAKQMVHGHAQALHAIDDGAPTYPAAGIWGGGFDPPDGKPWSDIAYVIGGYIRDAKFVDLDGFVMTDGVDGVHTQWNLAFPDNGAVAQFVAYLPDQATPLPYAYSCFVCHVTGAVESDPDSPTFQDNRPGMAGTFAEPGVQCEVCHGPGSNHAPSPHARQIYVDTTGLTCRECHVGSYRSQDRTIAASGGYIVQTQQQRELWASGGHSTFSCVFCHEPHVSANYDTQAAIINDCEDCHPDFDLGFHAGKTYVRRAYSEALTCRSCHMPYATLTASAAGEDVVGDVGRMADTHTHIFRINTENADYTAMFTESGEAVAVDAEGRAAVTVDFVCLRCHNGFGNASRFRVRDASAIARSIHVSN